MHRGRVAASGTVAEVVRSAGIASRIQIRVAPEDVATATDLLRGLGHVEAVEPDRSGELEITLADGAPHGNPLATTLIDDGIPIQQFEVTSGRLGDAFFALTDADRVALEVNHAG
jgi:hypothetical protein